MGGARSPSRLASSRREHNHVEECLLEEKDDLLALEVVGHIHAHGLTAEDGMSHKV